MASSASSLHFLSLTPNSISLSNSKPTPTSSISLSSPKPLPKSASLSTSFLHVSARPFDSPPSRFVARNVAVSSDFGQEGALSDAEEPNFSPDLKLFVGNLPFSVDSATLAELFERAGNVEMVEVIYDKLSGRSRGFGFVTMSTVEEAKEAAKQFNGYEIEGRPLRVNAGPPPPREDREPSFRGPRTGTSFDDSYRLYVGNLAWGVDDSALETVFSEQGKVLEARVVYDRDTGRSRGFGFITYSSEDEVNNAIQSLDGADISGRAIRVSRAEARPRRF